MSSKDPFKRKLEYDLRVYGEEYLLSELATSAFLPGYAFPSGVATFDHYSVYNFKRNIKRGKSVNSRVDNLTRLRERPARDMAVAVREYSPGSEVVIDGLMYKSAGILLNKPVKMSIEWRCHQCGSLGQSLSTLFRNQCIECGAELRQEHIKEFIEPLGFAVDFYSSPSTDISSQTYMPVKEPWISANDELKPLYNPALGSFRSSSEGHIFNYSSGENDEGYAICLKCGRAASMHSRDEFPKELKPGKTHKRLQGKAGDEENAICTGGESQYSIVKNIHLGATDQTDVFELYLKDPKKNQYIQHKSGDTILWTLAVSLRQSLADIHGVTADEIGYTVKPISLPGCSSAAAIALYDRCGGGAGFSSSAPYYIKDMLIKARENLECPDNCESACQSCLLGYDTRYHESVLDRLKTMEFLDGLLEFANMPEELKIFGDDTEHCLNNIDLEIIKKAEQGYDSISMFLQGDTSSWDLVESGVKGRIINWMKHFSEVNVIMAASEEQLSDEKLREDLATLKAIGANLSITSESDLPLAILNKNGQPFAYDIADDSLVGEPSSEFWNHQNLTLVCGKPSRTPKSSEYEIEFGFNKQLAQGDVEVEISSECDTQVIRFGLTLWNTLCKHNNKLNELIERGTKIKDISYTDAYICSPWSFLLYTAVIDGLKQKLKKVWGSPTISLTTSNKEPNSKAKGLYSEWDDKGLQKEVFKSLFQKLGEDLEVNFEEIKQMPHSRSLVIEWETGDITTVRFDHGMGYWSVNSNGRVWFDTNYGAEKQIQFLAQALKNTSTKQGRNFPTQIFIKHR